MKKFFKVLNNKICKGLTLLIIPSNGTAVKSFKISFSIVIALLAILITNIYFIYSYTAQNRRLHQCEKILSLKDREISVLQNNQKKLKPTLAKTYQINDELTRLKLQRLKILESWKAIQRNSDSNRTVSRSRNNNREVDYRLPLYQESQMEPAVNLLETNSNQIQKYLEIEQLKQKKLFEDIANYQKKLEYIPSLNPLSYSRITSWFGKRIHPKLGFSRLHTGIDMGTPVGTKVYATAAGTVNFVGYQNGYGNIVILDHGYGYQTIYGHNSKLLVKQGQKIKKGQVISLSGNTGTSTGPHLHYEVRVESEPVNPILFLKS